MNNLPPKILTMEEYERDWKPLGWRLIIIGPTSTWREEWGNWESIRDIVQNCLDETENYEYGYDNEGFFIKDKGKGVLVADFLLGPPKLKPEYARGRFGEGMKIAALALTRMGYRVRVETIGREIVVFFLTQRTNGQAETLSALWRPNGSKIGTTFHLIGYDGDDFKQNFVQNIPDYAIVFRSPSSLKSPIKRNNFIIQYDFPEESTTGWSTVKKGKIFVRDIYLKDIDSVFSYNLWGFDLAPDRHGPKDEKQLWIDISKTWACVDDVNLLEKFFMMVAEPQLLKTEEGRRLQLSYLGETSQGTSYRSIISSNAQYWQDAFIRVFGPDTVMKTSDKFDSMVKHLGYSSVTLDYDIRDGLSDIIKTDAKLIKESQDRLRDYQIIADVSLSPAQLVHLKLIRDIAGSVAYGISNVYAAIIPPASDRARTAGMYSKTLKEVYISLPQLDHADTAIDAGIHEIAHHSSGSDDLTEGHANEMTRIASKIVENIHKGNFDEVIKSDDFVW